MQTIKSPRDYTGYLIRTHKSCGATMRVHVPGFKGNMITPAEIEALGGRVRDGARAFGSANPVYCLNAVLIPCKGCGLTLNLEYFKPMYGSFVEEKVCGGKCMNATGPSCDCSCGGMNHGRGHGTEVLAPAL